MGNKIKIGRNYPCPCLSGKKYKHCCLDNIPWPSILQKNFKKQFHYLSLRGKNIAFLSAIGTALQLDKLDKTNSWADLKKAVTPKAVRFIHETILDIWPDRSDLKRILVELSKDSSGLYIGQYEPHLVLRGVTRHCLYNDAIVLIDPFIYPTSVREEFNPILNPETYITSTIKSLIIWFAMEPWIRAGIVKFIRTPGDLDPRLNFECLQIEKQRFDNNPKLKKILDDTVKSGIEDSIDFELFKQYMLYIQPDEYIKKILTEVEPKIKDGEIKKYFKYIDKLREEHPFLPHKNKDEKHPELITMSSGTNYEMAKIIAHLSNSILITDIESRWKEIELDRQENLVDEGNWSPFAKAFQELNWKYLENIDLNSALHLRRQNRLEDMRSFFRKVWRMSTAEKPFTLESSENLSAELNEQVREAEYEWKKIDRELLKYFGGTLAAGMVAAGPAIASGKGSFVAAALATAGVTELAVTKFKRSQFPKKYPAGFFLGH